MGIKVKLRQKPISGQRSTLYLDFYPAIEDPETGKTTRREFLKLYVYDEVGVTNEGKTFKIKLSPINKKSNQDTLLIAEQIRQKRHNELNKPEVYTEFEKEQLKIKALGEKDFVAYFKELSNKRQSSNHDNWVSAYNYLETFTGGTLKFAAINQKFCEDFKEHLLTTKSNRRSKENLSRNSAVSYFNKFKATLKQAYKDGYLRTDINASVPSIKPAETKRNFLTIEELNELIKTECHDKLMKQAALFSALTGLRFSDIQKLKWKEVEFIAGTGYFLRFVQKKTQGVETLPIAEQAFYLLGERRGPDDQVFEGLTYSAYANKHLANWIGKAKIAKDITFHCFRHTYATLQLRGGTDLYTVSKMLGHREIKTTQIYAKIVDELKQETTNKIVLNF